MILEQLYYRLGYTKVQLSGMIQSYENIDSEKLQAMKQIIAHYEKEIDTLKSPLYEALNGNENRR
jgi:uncharacterized protein Yka (UPF0111/DUF47 family)